MTDEPLVLAAVDLAAFGALIEELARDERPAIEPGLLARLVAAGLVAEGEPRLMRRVGPWGHLLVRPPCRIDLDVHLAGQQTSASVLVGPETALVIRRVGDDVFVVPLLSTAALEMIVGLLPTAPGHLDGVGLAEGERLDLLGAISVTAAVRTVDGDHGAVLRLLVARDGRIAVRVGDEAYEIASLNQVVAALAMLLGPIESLIDTAYEATHPVDPDFEHVAIGDD